MTIMTTSATIVKIATTMSTFMITIILILTIEQAIPTVSGTFKMFSLMNCGDIDDDNDDDDDNNDDDDDCSHDVSDLRIRSASQMTRAYLVS